MKNVKDRRFGWFKITFLLLFAACSALAASGAAHQKHYPAPPPSFLTLKHASAWVGFSPNDGAQKLVLAAIRQAKHVLLMQAYSCTNRKIIAALIKAKHRGVKVRVIADREDPTERYSCIPALLSAHIPVWIDEGVKIAHNKVMVIDGQYVLTGSFNFSWSAAHRNAENVLVIHSAKLAHVYTENWYWRLGHSIRYYGRQGRG